MQARLLDRKRLLNREGVITLFPAVDDIEALTPAQRAIVYTELGKSQLNEYQHDPVFIFGGDIDDWLREAALTDAQKSLVRKMAWRRGRALAFSDIPVLLSHAQSDAEVNGIFKLATRVRTLLAELKLPVGVNVKPLLEYWTAGRRMTDSVPLLKSVAQRDCITALDATHLLPPFARHRVYTYPTLDLATRGRMPDCHWTSLNFFNTEPQNYYLDTRLASSHIQEHYKAADGPFQFGDVLVLLDGKGESRHSCVYVAGDMVFTKNGENALMPWLLMWLDDVREIYQENADWPVQAYRLRRGN